MKLFKTAFIFAAGVTAGYFIAKNRVELSVNIEPIVEKIKDHLTDLGIIAGDCCCCDSDDDCITSCTCDCQDEAPEVNEG